jgi:hypothetical protein
MERNTRGTSLSAEHCILNIEILDDGAIYPAILASFPATADVLRFSTTTAIV